MAQSKKDMEILQKVYADLDYSAKSYHKLFKEIMNDFKFVQGEQWDNVDIETLRAAGVKALTINKIKPIIKLITGIERQSRSDFKAFPEGEEDVITGEIASKLLKNISKGSNVERKHSAQFKDGCIGGVSYIEPYMDYSYDLIHGSMQFKKLSAQDVYPDPEAIEYDLSDGKFMIKVTKDLTEDQMVVLFPDKEKEIKAMGSGQINWESIKDIGECSSEELSIIPQRSDRVDGSDGSYDLIEYQYKDLEKQYFVAVQEQGLVKNVRTKEEAEELSSQIPGSIIISKMVPIVRLAAITGTQVLDDDVAWFYPNWKKFSILPYFAEEMSENMGDKSLNIQGIVRTIKDLQEEFNKRRTQELRHLNSSANSGFDVEKGQLDDQNLAKLKKYGSSAGIVIERNKGTLPITRITPMPLSQGHAQLAEENAQDLKEASGVNPDLLATDSKSQSGRAILLKQRQGLVMIQEMLDNFSETKKLTGQFMLSQLKEVFTVESALKVLGDAWVADNFTVPVNIILERGLGKVEGDEQPSELEQAVMLQYPQQEPNQPIVDETNNLVTTVDFDTAIMLVNSVLNDSELGKYDVAIGEGPYAETIRMANFLDMKDLATQGVPIPPESIIELSMIPEGQKKKILKSIQAQQQAMAMQAQQGQQ